MRLKLLAVIAAAILSTAGSCHRPPNPTPTPTPTPAPTPTPTPDPGPVPPKGQPVGPERLLRIKPGASGYVTNDGHNLKMFGAEACCEEWKKCPESAVDSFGIFGAGWPSLSQCWLDQLLPYKVNMVHNRLAPWWGSDAGEPLWKNVGGAYNPDGSKNQKFWDIQRQFAWDLFKREMYEEVVIGDDWWLKGACGRDVQCDKQVPWSQEAVKAWGKTWHPEHDALYKTAIEELGCFGNVVFVTGNEEDLVPGTTREHVKARLAAIRKYEQEVGCGFVHLVGTGSWMGGIGADYQVTHDTVPVTGPCGPDGLSCVNNEHNKKGEFTPNEEASLYQRAFNAGQRWDLWRAGSNDADYEAKLTLAKGIYEGGGTPVGCFAPDGDSDKWEDPPTEPGQKPVSQPVMAAYNDAKAKVGDRTGATGQCTPAREPCSPNPIFIGCQDTTDMLAAEMRKTGLCASGSWGGGPELAVLDSDGWWKQFHPCATETGGYTGNPYKFAWKYLGENPTPPPTSQCVNPPAPSSVDHFDVNPNHSKGPNKTIVDSTPKVHNRDYCALIGYTDGRLDCPVRMEGDPLSVVCTDEAVGTPVWVTIPPQGRVSPENAYQIWVPRGQQGPAKVCSSRNMNACGMGQVTP